MNNLRRHHVLSERHTNTEKKLERIEEKLNRLVKGMNESRGRMLKDLANIKVKFRGTGFEPVEEVRRLFKNNIAYNLLELVIMLHRNFGEDFSFGFVVDELDDGEVEVEVFDENDDKVGCLFFKLLDKVDNEIAVEDAMNNFYNDLS